MSSYLITGASGFIGSQIISALTEKRNEDNSYFIICRNIDKTKEKISDSLNSNFHFFESSIEIFDFNQLKNEKIDYIIHCACPTASKYMVEHPIKTLDAIVLGTKNILEYASKANIKSMVYLSSMEVYGAVYDDSKKYHENDLGEIDLTSQRSCYPEGKRIAEHYCYIYNVEYGVPVKVARLSQVFGKGSSPNDTRVFMQFAKSAFYENDIILKTKGDSMGNYCATEDAVAAILKILYSGCNGETYNVANEDLAMQIIDMAQLVSSKIANNKIKVVIEEQDNKITGYAPKTSLVMSNDKLKELGWIPKKNMIEMYQDLIEILSKEEAK